MFFLIFWLLVGIVLRGGAPAPPGPEDHAEAGLLTRAVRVGQTSYDYQVYVPAGLRGKKDAPVMLFLHGIGQRGEGGFVSGRGLTGEMVRGYLEQLPAIAVLPQCRKNRYWHDEDMEKMTVAALDAAVQEFGGDRRRIYLIGISMGGYGAWHLAAQYPGKFAAVVPICGGSPLRTADRFTRLASRIGRTPVWAFHGAEDGVVPVTESRNLVAALKAARGNVKYSEYPGVGHNVWFNVLAERELLPWMLSQRLEK